MIRMYNQTDVSMQSGFTDIRLCWSLYSRQHGRRTEIPISLLGGQSTVSRVSRARNKIQLSLTKVSVAVEISCASSVVTVVKRIFDFPRNCYVISDYLRLSAAPNIWNSLNVNDRTVDSLLLNCSYIN
jgi:hypothetical protein